MAATELHFNSMAVRQAASSCAQRQTTMANAVQGVVENLADVANVLAQASDADKVGELRDALKELLNMKHTVTLHTAALEELHNSYEMSAAATDFERQIATRVQQLATQQQGYDPTQDELYRVFEDAAGAGGDEAGEEQLDEDIAIEGGAHQLAPNERCGMTGKLLLELEDPVMDSRGFVYEKAAILGWIQQHHGRAKCPNAGTAHFVTVGELKPASRVQKAQQRARRAGGASAHHQMQGGQDFLDVE